MASAIFLLEIPEGVKVVSAIYLQEEIVEGEQELREMEAEERVVEMELEEEKVETSQIEMEAIVEEGQYVREAEILERADVMENEKEAGERKPKIQAGRRVQNKRDVDKPLRRSNRARSVKKTY